MSRNNSPQNKRSQNNRPQKSSSDRHDTTQRDAIRRLQKLKPLAQAVGGFIDYWGFRAIHGQIWTVLWLSRGPLKVTEIAKVLGVSKALASPALVQLEDYGLVRESPSDDKRHRTFTANEDVIRVIKSILSTREKTILATSAAEASYIKQMIAAQSGLESVVSEERLERITAMIQSAQGGLDLLLAFDFLHMDLFKPEMFQVK